MSQEIRKEYHKAGLKPPNGKGIHTKRAHQCVINYQKKGLSKNEAWKRCMGGLGSKLAVKKSHQRSEAGAKRALRRRTRG